MVWLVQSPQVLSAQLQLTTFAKYALPQLALISRQSMTDSDQKLLKCTWLFCRPAIIYRDYCCLSYTWLTDAQIDTLVITLAIGCKACCAAVPEDASGSVTVKEQRWGERLANLGGPFDVIVACGVLCFLIDLPIIKSEPCAYAQNDTNASCQQ